MIKPQANHVVLLGDSIFDNGVYVAGGPDVVTQLRAALPDGWAATLLAVDGATTRDVQRQLRLLPAEATHLVLSVGGNDALQHQNLLHESADSVGEALHMLSGAKRSFEADYRAALEAVLAHKLPAIITTIYDSNFDNPDEKAIADTGVCIFNDVITREASARRLRFIDLRVLFDSREDYANPIEPSVRGGEKIARAITHLVTDHSEFAR